MSRGSVDEGGGGACDQAGAVDPGAAELAVFPPPALLLSSAVFELWFPFPVLFVLLPGKAAS
jgi:hypothetical protein